MRLVLAMVLAGLVALPLRVSAQAGEDDPLSGEPAPSPEPEPALQLKLDEAGVGVAPPPSRTPDGYTVEEMELRVKRAKIGFGVSAGVVGAGMVLLTTAIAIGGTEGVPKGATQTGIAGGALTGAGILAMYSTLGIWVHRARKLRKLRQATPRRVQWDLARSRLVF